jgi:LysR family glycine cleavage system transcriptional activator
MAVSRRLLPSISALRALEALDRHGSASAAAAELALTQGAVSRQIQALEAQVGVALSTRIDRRLVLTAEGSDYAAEIRHALDQIARATVMLQSGPVGGTLSLAILPAFGMRWLMPRLPDFARRHPDVTINMATRLEPFSFAGEAFDAALHYGHRDWPGTEALLLKREHLLPVAAPGLVASRHVDTPADLLKLPLLHIQTRPRAWAAWFAAAGVPLDGALPGTMYDQFATITQAALHGLGAALMPDYLVEQEVATGRLVALAPQAVEADGAYYLVWLARPAHRAHRIARRHAGTSALRSRPICTSTVRVST